MLDFRESAAPVGGAELLVRDGETVPHVGRSVRGTRPQINQLSVRQGSHPVTGRHCASNEDCPRALAVWGGTHRGRAPESLICMVSLTYHMQQAIDSCLVSCVELQNLCNCDLFSVSTLVNLSRPGLVPTAPLHILQMYGWMEHSRHGRIAWNSGTWTLRTVPQVFASVSVDPHVATIQINPGPASYLRWASGRSSSLYCADHHMSCEMTHDL